MQSDQDELGARPTVPNLRPYDDTGERDPRGVPAWPAVHPHMLGTRVAASSPLSLALALSLGINVALLIGLMGTLLLARAGAFAPPRSAAAQSVETGSPTSAALGTPTPSTPLSTGWLQVAPSSVQLGCGGDQQTQSVVLTNSGPHRVQWQAVFAVPTDQAGVEVGPNQGDLRPGASVVLQIHDTNPSTTQQGVVRFEPDSSAAGTPPSLTYTAPSCG